MDIWLETMEVSLKDKDMKKAKCQLVQLAKEEKKRNLDSKRISGCQFDLEKYRRLKRDNKELTTPLKAFGLAWSTQIKGKKFAKPSIEEVITGLKELIFHKLAYSTS